MRADFMSIEVIFRELSVLELEGERLVFELRGSLALLRLFLETSVLMRLMFLDDVGVDDLKIPELDRDPPLIWLWLASPG
ncbi:hypothetical protein DND58_29725 [Pseudomonas syringae pv. pisi]|nr:hypothetical protein DND58_29725 [Pseudomonas syringae pv. pisi]